MLLVADVHGEFNALSRLVRTGEPLLILGDLINYVDYRTLDGIAADPQYLDISVPAGVKKTFKIDTYRRSFAYVFEGSAAFAHDETISAFAKGPAASGAQGTNLTEFDEDGGAHVAIHAAGDGEVTLIVAQGPHRRGDRRQRRGAGRVHGVAWPAIAYRAKPFPPAGWRGCSG